MFKHPTGPPCTEKLLLQFGVVSYLCVTSRGQITFLCGHFLARVISESVQLYLHLHRAGYLWIASLQSFVCCICFHL